MDLISAREPRQSLANYVAGRRFFVRYGVGNVIISALMLRTKKRPNVALFATLAVATMIHTAMADQFTYDIQLAGYDYDRYDEKGVIDYDVFVRAFDHVPWREQMQARQKVGKGCSATISVTDHPREIDYWVSVAGEVDPELLLGIVYEKEVKGFLRSEERRV